MPAEPCRPLFFAAALLLVGVADAQGPDDGGRVGIAAAIAGGAVVVIASAVAAYLFVRRRRRQRVQTMKTEEEMGVYERQQEVERAARALQRAREVLAQRTGHLDWNPQLAAKNEAVQLMDVDDGGGPGGLPGGGDMMDWANAMGMDGAAAAAMGPMKTSEKAVELVAEFGAQGAVMQVMQAAKEVLERELRELERDGDEEFEEAVGGVEDSEWRERLHQQMQYQDLQKQLAIIEEETEDMLSEDEKQRKRELDALDREGIVEISMPFGIDRKITVRREPPPPPRPVPWSRMVQVLHRDETSEMLVQRSTGESQAVAGFSHAMRNLQNEIERQEHMDALELTEAAQGLQPAVGDIRGPGATMLAPVQPMQLPLHIQHGKQRLFDNVLDINPV